MFAQAYLTNAARRPGCDQAAPSNGGVGHLVQIVGVRAGNKAQTVQIGTLKKAGRTMAGELSQRKP